MVPHHDFAVILEDSLDRDGPEFAALLGGYGMAFAEFQEIEREIMAVWLLRAVDKVRWAQDRAPAALPGTIRALQRAFDARAALDGGERDR